MRTLIAICYLVFGFSASGQIISQSVLFSENPMWINPAFSGLEEETNFNLDYRKQWLGLETSPQHLLASAEFNVQDRLGIGLQLESSSAAISTNNTFQVSSAYHVNISENNRLHAGLSLGYSRFSTDVSKAEFVDPSDPMLAADMASSSSLKAGLGLGLSGTKFQLGLSIPELVSFGDDSELVLRLHGLYKIELGSSFRLIPALKLDQVFNSDLFAYNVSVGLSFKEKLDLRLMTDYNSTSSIILGLRISEKLNLSYAFSYAGSDYTYRGSSQELSLKFVIPNRTE